MLILLRIIMPAMSAWYGLRGGPVPSLVSAYRHLVALRHARRLVARADRASDRGQPIRALLILRQADVVLAQAGVRT